MSVEEFIQYNQRERKETGSLKWDDLKSRFGNKDLLPLWVADMDFSTPETVKESLTKRIEHGIFGYPKDTSDYYNAFADWQQKRHQVTLKEDWFRFSTGVVQSIYHLLLCFSEEGDGVIIQPPVYYPFFNAIKDTNRKLIVSPLKEKNLHYEFDLDDFEEQLITHRPKIFILCSPHNPVGRIWSQKELDDILTLCHKYDCLVISDEIHQDFEISARPFLSTLSNELKKYHENLIVINAPSKTFNLASLLTSHIIIPNDEVRKQFDRKIKIYQQTEKSLLGLLAGQTAYETGAEWFDSLLDVIKQNFLSLEKRLEEVPHVPYAPLEGTYLAWIDLRKIVSGQEIKKLVQDDAGLAVDYGEWFSEDCSGFIRLNLATTPAILEKALNQLIDAIKKESGVNND